MPAQSDTLELPPIYWNGEEDGPRCRCRIITATAQGKIVAKVTAPRQKPPRPNTLKGKNALSEWNPSASLRNPLPCKLQVDLPQQPPAGGAGFSISAAAGPFTLMGLFGSSMSQTTLNLQGTYHIQPKEEVAGGTVVSTLDATLKGVQYIGGVKFGNGQARLIVTLNVQPFGIFVLKSGFSDATGTISAKARKIVVPTPDGGTKTFDIPAQAGNPNEFTQKLKQQKQAVPCCKPQPFSVEMDVMAQRKHLFGVSSVISSFQFMIQAPDPPDDIEGTVVELEVDTITGPEPPLPKAAPGVSVTCLLPEGPEIFTGMVEDNGKLILVRQRGTPAFNEPIVSDLVELDLTTAEVKVVLRELQRSVLGFVSRLRRVTLPDAEDPKLVAVELGTPDLRSGVPFSGDGRVVAIEDDGELSVIADNLDLPTDVTSLNFDDSTFMVVSTAGDGQLFKWDGGDELPRFSDCLTTPVAVVTPPTDSPFEGHLYTAEFGNISDVPDVESRSGRILEFDLENRKVKTFAAGIAPRAMAFSPGGPFGTDLIVVTANVVEPGTGEPVPNTGQVLRFEPSCAMTPLVISIDDPVDVVFSREGRCFVLAASGIFEVSTSGDVEEVDEH